MNEGQISFFLTVSSEPELARSKQTMYCQARYFIAQSRFKDGKSTFRSIGLLLSLKYDFVSVDFRIVSMFYRPVVIKLRTELQP